HVPMRGWITIMAIALSACSPGSTANPATPSPSASATLTSTPTLRSTIEPTPPSSPPATLASPAAPSPTAVRFVDRDHGWLGLNDGILGSIDGGTTWSRQLSGVPVGRLWAYDATNAWALSGNDLYRT